jgi:serine/threonine protein kinase
MNDSNEFTGIIRNSISPKKIPFKINRVYKVKKRKGIIGRYYVPMRTIRPNSKGDISWGINMKNWAFTPCVIKQARSFSFYDSIGREPKHKLMWQKAVLEDIQDEVSVPRLIDFCKKKEDYYLIMEFIEGDSLHEKVKKMYDGESWTKMADNTKKNLLMLFKDAVDIVSALHRKGYVHRDITDTNFVVDLHGKMYLLDFELTCSITSGLPDPPHGLGTMGYVSPEQMRSDKPTFKEDIYSLGALLLSVLTRKNPQELIGENVEGNIIKIETLIGNTVMTALILQCTDINPLNRPELGQLINIIDKEIGKYHYSGGIGLIEQNLFQGASII